MPQKEEMRSLIQDNINWHDVILIGGTSFFMTELTETCKEQKDVWLFLAAGGLLLVTEIFNNQTFTLNNQEIEKEIKHHYCPVNYGINSIG